VSFRRFVSAIVVFEVNKKVMRIYTIFCNNLKGSKQRTVGVTTLIEFLELIDLVFSQNSRGLVSVEYVSGEFDD